MEAGVQCNNYQVLSTKSSSKLLADTTLFFLVLFWGEDKLGNSCDFLFEDRFNRLMDWGKALFRSKGPKPIDPSLHYVRRNWKQRYHPLVSNQSSIGVMNKDISRASAQLVDTSIHLTQSRVYFSPRYLYGKL